MRQIERVTYIFEGKKRKSAEEETKRGKVGNKNEKKKQEWKKVSKKVRKEEDRKRRGISNDEMISYKSYNIIL